MPKKDFTLDSGLAITIYKRRASRHLRLSVSPVGHIKVSIPAWASYKMGLDFAHSREDWLLTQTHTRRLNLLSNGQAVGKAHHLEFIEQSGESKPTSRVLSSSVRVFYPEGYSISDKEVQLAAEKACLRALRVQAEKLLPQRLEDLAVKYGYSYNEVSIKRLKGRWGSCDQHSNIVLNLFLMQLPWELIDYVLLHELTHTKILKHGPTFWQAMTKNSPKIKTLRKSIKEYSPVVLGRSDEAS
jgi:predicted metal-dependent hydrolase